MDLKPSQILNLVSNFDNVHMPQIPQIVTIEKQKNKTKLTKNKQTGLIITFQCKDFYVVT